MLIIGEKINGTLKRTATAIEARDKAYIQESAINQVSAGADYIDVNAGTKSQRESDDMIWLIETVQAVIDVPLCLDSASPDTLRRGLEHVTQTPMINSISGEAELLDGILPSAAKVQAPIIALLLDENGIPEDVDTRLKIGDKILQRTRLAGIKDKLIFVDPLSMAVSTNTNGAVIALETMRLLRESNPDIKFCLGLSNVSYGLPLRKIINQAFLAQLLAAGLDAAIINPMDQGLMNMLYSTELVLGKDRFCQRFTTAYRKKIIQ